MIFRNVLIFVVLVLLNGCNSKTQFPLRQSEINPRYFTDNSGKAVYLTGSHTWNNLVDMIQPSNKTDTFDFPAYIDFMNQYNHNFMRLWTWELLTWNTTANREEQPEILEVYPHPWARTGPGVAVDEKPKFDLDRFNPIYFQRLRERAEAAQKENIYVAVMLFEGWGLQFSPEAYRNHPFHPLNNINKLGLDTGTYAEPLKIHELKHQKITAIQEAYVRRILETLNDLGNVLYEISNENHPESTEWQYHMIEFIKNTESEMEYQHPVGMTFQYKGGSNKDLFKSPADWVSPNPEGGYRDDPPPDNRGKVIIADTDHLWGIGGNYKWVWKSFFRGLNPIFMDPYDGRVLSRGSGSDWAEEIRICMGITRKLANRIGIIDFIPKGELSSSGYCLSDPGSGYLIYLPEGNQLQVDLSADEGEFSVEWINQMNGEIISENMITAGEVMNFTCPYDSLGGVLYVTKVP